MWFLWDPSAWRLAHSSPKWEAFWRVALVEAIVFAAAGFQVDRCTHGEHWYLSGDARQKDCPPHNKAGEQARWRQKKQERDREKSRQTTLRSHAGGGGQ